MNLRAKIFAMISSLLVVVLMLTALSIWVSQRRLLLREISQRQAAAVDGLAGIQREANVMQDPLLVVSYMRLLRNMYPEASWLCAADAAGIVQASSDTGALGLDRKRVVMPAGAILLVRPVFVNGRRLGSVEVGFDGKMVRRYIRRSLLRVGIQLSVVTLGALILGFICSFFLAYGIAEPIRALAQAACEFGRGDFSVAIAVNRRDEVGDLARAFLEMGVRLKELDRLKQEFLDSTTHELRTPLGAIESHANAVLDDLEENRTMTPEYREDWISSLRQIKNNTARQRRYVNNLLDRAKIESGKFDIKVRDVGLLDTLKEATEFFGPTASERGIALSCDLPDEFLRVSADPERLHQVLLNLVGNAIKFTPAGGSIRISAREASGDRVRVEVSDTGPGIPKEFLGSLFTRFAQYRDPAARARDAAGTGLGLAICKAIIESHGGQIGAVSEVGRGSAFYFTLHRVRGGVKEKA